VLEFDWRYVRAFPPFLQDRREVWTASDTSGNQNSGRAANLAIFSDIWDALLPSVSLECMTIERLTLALVVAAAVVPRSTTKSVAVK